MLYSLMLDLMLEAKGGDGDALEPSIPVKVVHAPRPDRCDGSLRTAIVPEKAQFPACLRGESWAELNQMLWPQN